MKLMREGQAVLKLRTEGKESTQLCHSVHKVLGPWVTVVDVKAVRATVSCEETLLIEFKRNDNFLDKFYSS